MLGNILNSVASSVLGNNDGQTKATQLIQSLLQSQGGIQGIMEKFQQGGLEQLVKSWIGTGENLPISVEQILDIFGKKEIDSAADDVGVSQQDAPNLLSEYLPQIVDQLSPNGQLNLNNLDLSALAKMALGNLFK